MDRRTGTLLLVTAALWGVPYLLIKIAVGELSPFVIVFGRVAIGAAIVAAVAARRGVLGGLRGRLRDVLVLALVQLAGPFVLLAYGERHISSSLAGVLVATTPILTGLLAFVVPDADRPTGLRALGLALGICGVALVLPDVVMPGAGAPEFRRRLELRSPRAAVIFMSGYPDGLSTGESVLPPGAQYLAKPFSTEAMLRKVRDLLDQDALRAEGGTMVEG